MSKFWPLPGHCVSGPAFPPETSKETLPGTGVITDLFDLITLGNKVVQLDGIL